MAKLDLEQMKKLVATSRKEVDRLFDGSPLDVAENAIGVLMERPIQAVLSYPDIEVGIRMLQLIIATTCMDYLVKRYEREGITDRDISDAHAAEVEQLIKERD